MAGDLGQTFPVKVKEADEDTLPDMAAAFNMSLSIPSPSGTQKSSRKSAQPDIPYNPKEFEAGEWFYDTPGVIYQEQVSENCCYFLRNLNPLARRYL